MATACPRPASVETASGPDRSGASRERRGATSPRAAARAERNSCAAAAGDTRGPTARRRRVRRSGRSPRPDDRTILLLDVGAVVLAVRPTAGERDPLETTVVEQRAIDEFRAVIGVHSAEAS